MSWFADYCKAAERTDRFSARSNHLILLAAGLFGETGSVLAELKKMERENETYPSYRNRLVEEIGDVLWYFARLATVLAPDKLRQLDTVVRQASSQSESNAMNDALTLGGTVGTLLNTLQHNTGNATADQLDAIWHALIRIASTRDIELNEAAQMNLEKINSRWPTIHKFAPLFDDHLDEVEQIPRTLTVEFQQINAGGKKVMLLRCNGLNLGDRLTDNIGHPDFYRFHDIFHLAHAVFLGWSPVVRVLLNCKRKSDPKVDENQDGARARIIEEAISAIVFSHAKETRFYDGIDQVDYGLLKSISEFVRGYEVEKIPLWQWEQAILQGYRVFRELQRNGGGTVTLNLIDRHLHYTSPSRSRETA